MTDAYMPRLTSAGGIAAFCRGYLGHRFASTKQAVAMTQAFVQAIRSFLQEHDLELVRFQKGQRKDDVLQAKLRRFKQDEGVLFVGVAQEKVRVPRTTRKALPGGGTIPSMWPTKPMGPCVSKRAVCGCRGTTTPGGCCCRNPGARTWQGFPLTD